MLALWQGPQCTLLSFLEQAKLGDSGGATLPYRREAHLQTAKKTAPLVEGSASFARKSSAAAGNVLLSRGSITGCFLRAIRSHML